MDVTPTDFSDSLHRRVGRFHADALNDLARQIEAGTLHIQVGKTFHLGEIVEAHRLMEENKAGGKIVVLT